MENFFQTSTWKNTLGKEDLGDQASIDKLKNTFLSFRDKVKILAAEVSRSLPEYTVHDISHIDALWEMADCICGHDYELNPVEGFVLGGAFMLHDLGMSISAYPEGVSELEQTAIWKDAVAQKYHEIGEKCPEDISYENLNSDVKDFVLSNVLRKLHASAAEKLATTAWEQRSSGEQVFLIENTEARQSLGRIIGKIAHSHWWDINKVEQEFSRTIGAPSWCPSHWTIDPLKIACILRASDAAHIDERRAPSFLRSLRTLSAASDEHWCFQEKLQKPYLSEDSLFYTSGYHFPSVEAQAWWLCYEALKLIDRELRQVDALLADHRMSRFKAKRVFGVESPERLASLIQTENWEPIDAFIHIGDLPRIIRALGGDELYGKNPHIPIRELIQNSSDAIRARRALEGRGKQWGSVSIRRDSQDGISWIEVEDNGIGMSLEVVKRYLFEFGSSYWDSELMQDEHPGLTVKDVRHTGKYGIGFFSVFMLGDAVQIITRKCTEAQSDTYVVEFRNGLESRPIIRKANPDEYLLDGGTKIRVTIKDTDIYEKIFKSDEGDELSLYDVSVRIAPALDCELVIEGEENKIIKENYWIDCSNREFMDLLVSINSRRELSQSDDELSEFLDRAEANIDTITSPCGNVVGRGFLSLSLMHEGKGKPRLHGSVVVGGLSETMTSIISGLFLGKTRNAARDDATLVVEKSDLAAWASEQSKKVPLLYNEEEQYSLSSAIRQLNADIADLPVAKDLSHYYTLDDIRKVLNDSDEIIIADDFFLRYQVKNLIDISYLDNLFFSSIGGVPSIVHGKTGMSWGSGGSDKWNYNHTHLGYICDLISDVWAVSIEKLIEIIDGDTRANSKVKIGSVNGKPIVEHGYRFRKNELLAGD